METRKWPGSWFNAKERDLKKLLDRGEHKEALRLLVDVYYLPGTSLPMKQRCVQELVDLKVLTDPYLEVYKEASATLSRSWNCFMNWTIKRWCARFC